MEIGAFTFADVALSGGVQRSSDSLNVIFMIK